MMFKIFVFSVFQVNTIVLYDETGDCVIIDPACSNVGEQETLTRWIRENQLTPIEVWVTHPHVDHVFGVEYICKTYQIPLVMHPDAEALYHTVPGYAPMYGITDFKCIEISKTYNDGDFKKVGHQTFEVLYVPGHADGSVCFYNKENNILFTGDVLFKEGIGRTDLPTGNYKNLIQNITKKLLPLPDNTTVIPGHGDSTTIGHEKKSNPYF